MAKISFEGETHDELVTKVKRWLASVEGEPSSGLLVSDVVVQSAELTKDALRVIAGSAPEGVQQSELMKSLTSMGYTVTDATRDTALAGLETVESATGGSVVKNVADAGRNALFEMNAQMAKHLLKAIVDK